MQININELQGECLCSKEHTLNVRDIWLETDALLRLPDIIKENGWHDPAIISDENTWMAAGSKAYNLLDNAGITCKSVVLPAKELHANEIGVELACKGLAGLHDVLLAIGSGTVHDITRFIAYKRGIPFISIPTAASVDGFVSTVAAMTWKGCKKSFQAVAPLYVLVDIDIIESAPKRLTASGYADLFGKYTAIADWRISNVLTGEYICEKVIHLTEQALSEAIAARKDIARLMFGLLLSGLSMQMVGSSRPASGGEHHISHFWEMGVCNGPLDALHGEMVGVGLLLCSEEYHKISGLLKSGDIKVTPSNGLLKKDLEEGFQNIEMRKLLEEENTPDPTDGISGYDILANKDKICNILDKLPSAEDLSELLRSVGGKTNMEEIGLDPALKATTLRYSPYVRARLTMMRLRKLLGFTE